MKVLLHLLFLAFTFTGFAQSQFEVINEGNIKILKGIITKEDITGDTAFSWFTQNQSGYIPQTKAVNAFKNKGSQIQVIAFGGTWCSDTRDILPKFFSILDESGFPQDQLTLVGVDRDKKTISHLSEALGIINVPTFIILKNGKEIGRVVEYGKTGQWDKELGEIVETVK